MIVGSPWRRSSTSLSARPPRARPGELGQVQAVRIADRHGDHGARRRRSRSSRSARSRCRRRPARRGFVTKKSKLRARGAVFDHRADDDRRAAPRRSRPRAAQPPAIARLTAPPAQVAGRRSAAPSGRTARGRRSRRLGRPLIAPRSAGRRSGRAIHRASRLVSSRSPAGSAPGRTATEISSLLSGEELVGDPAGQARRREEQRGVDRAAVADHLQRPRSPRRARGRGRAPSPPRRPRRCRQHDAADHLPPGRAERRGAVL